MTQFTSFYGLIRLSFAMIMNTKCIKIKVLKNSQKILTKITNRELSTTKTPNLEELISTLEILLGNLNKSKMKLFNAKNIQNKKVYI